MLNSLSEFRVTPTSCETGPYGERNHYKTIKEKFTQTPLPEFDENVFRLAQDRIKKDENNLACFAWIRYFFSVGLHDIAKAFGIRAAAPFAWLNGDEIIPQVISKKFETIKLVCETGVPIDGAKKTLWALIVENNKLFDLGEGNELDEYEQHIKLALEQFNRMPKNTSRVDTKRRAINECATIDGQW